MDQFINKINTYKRSELLGVKSTLKLIERHHIKGHRAKSDRSKSLLPHVKKTNLRAYNECKNSSFREIAQTFLNFCHLLDLNRRCLLGFSSLVIFTKAEEVRTVRFDDQKKIDHLRNGFAGHYCFFSVGTNCHIFVASIGYRALDGIHISVIKIQSSCVWCTTYHRSKKYTDFCVTYQSRFSEESILQYVDYRPSIKRVLRVFLEQG